jgi:hypothetical protein
LQTCLLRQISNANSAFLLPILFSLPPSFLLSRDPPTFVMASEFHLYPLLPTELQIKIWEHTLKEPRIIEIGETRKDRIWKGRVVDRVDLWTQIQITTNGSHSTLIPAALETCITSREVALQYYGRLDSARTWFNPALDTLYFGKDWAHMEGLEHWRDLVRKNREIRHIAFHIPTARHREDFFCIGEVALKPHIEEVTFILDAPIISSSNAATPRFKCIKHHDIAIDKSLRAIGKFFREAQSHIMTEAWDTHDGFFRRWGFYPDDETRPHTWKMPNIKFMLEDEHQAREARRDRQLQQELAAIKRAEAIP